MVKSSTCELVAKVHFYLRITKIHKIFIARHACLNLQRVNFMGHSPFFTQCRPEDPLTGRRFGASVCRQCFPTCNGGSDCFSNTNGIQDRMSQLNTSIKIIVDSFQCQLDLAYSHPLKTRSGVSLDIVGTNANCQSASSCNVGRSFWDADLLTCAAQTNLVTPLTECSNTNYPPLYDGYSAITHMN